jgi:hypothetical protein
MTVGSLTREKTLYGLLGAHPDDDAERLRDAFRKAAKANHPDLHAGDQDAPARFRQIVEAYDVLRNVEQRAAYDRLLALEREQRRSKSKRATSYFMYNVVFDAVAVAGLASVLAGGYTLFTHHSKAPVEAVKVVGVTAPGPAKTATAQPAARTATAGPDEKRDNIEHMTVPEMPMMVPSALALAANDGGALDVAKGGPAPSSTGLKAEVAKTNNAFGAPIDQADAKTAENHLEKNLGIEPLGKDKAQSVEARSSSAETDDGIPKSASSNFAMSEDKRDMKIPDTSNLNPNIKVPEMKMPERPRTVAKRQPASPAPVRQVSLENRYTSACSGSHSCSGDIPPLFGVGF